jgi:hypothetical protein
VFLKIGAGVGAHGHHAQPFRVRGIECGYDKALAEPVAAVPLRHFGVNKRQRTVGAPVLEERRLLIYWEFESLRFPIVDDAICR